MIFLSPRDFLRPFEFSRHPWDLYSTLLLSAAQC
jgi:hypothetical protein